MLDEQSPVYFFAAAVLCFTLFHLCMQKSPAERVAEIQGACATPNWTAGLFYDFRHSRSLAYRILKLDERCWRHAAGSITSPPRVNRGNCAVSIEQFKLDSSRAGNLSSRLAGIARAAAGGAHPAGEGIERRVAMQYSPMNDIRNISRVDPEPLSSFARLESHPSRVRNWCNDSKLCFLRLSTKCTWKRQIIMHRIIQEAFAEIARRIRAGEPTTEWDIAQLCSADTRKKDGAGADDRRSEREHRQCRTTCRQGKELVINARFRVDRCGYEIQ